MADMVCLTHDPTYNIMCKGPFPSMEGIRNLPEDNKDERVKRIENLFLGRHTLEQEEISEVLDSINKIFIDKLMRKGVPRAKFGSNHKEFTDAMREYKAAVINYMVDWQATHKSKHGQQGLNMVVRVAYALRAPGKNMAPRPLLTYSFIQVLDFLFGRISNAIEEVRFSFMFYIIPTTCYTGA